MQYTHRGGLVPPQVYRSREPRSVAGLYRRPTTTATTARHPRRHARGSTYLGEFLFLSWLSNCYSYRPLLSTNRPAIRFRLSTPCGQRFRGVPLRSSEVTNATARLDAIADVSLIHVHQRHCSARQVTGFHGHTNFSTFKPSNYSS